MVTAIIVEEDPAFDPDAHPVNPHNWENRATSPDGPIPADGTHDHGDGDGAHDHDEVAADA